MTKGLLIASFLALILLSSTVLVTAKTPNIPPIVLPYTCGTVWSFDNFYNNYKLYKTASCDVEKLKTCRNELSWMGNQITFKYTLPTLGGLGDTLRFNFYVTYYDNYGKPKDAILEIVSGQYKTELTVNSVGLWSVDIPKSSLMLGKNQIRMKGKNIDPGYGHHPPTVVLSYVELENP